MRSRRPTMPFWPAWILIGTAAACAYPAMTTRPPAEQRLYEARGQEPGWHLAISEARIEFEGNYGDVRIAAPRPQPTPIANGRRYATPRLRVEIIEMICNDAMSGHGSEHRVTVTADGQTFHGCGGARRPDLDS